MKKTVPVLEPAAPSHANKSKAFVSTSSRLRPKIAEQLPRSKRAKAANGANGGADESNGHLDAAQVLSALMALKNGDFSIRLPSFWTGIAGKVADTFNETAEMMSRSTEELSRISRVVGKEGRIQERLTVIQATGAWSERVNSVNNLIDCLAHP